MPLSSCWNHTIDLCSSPDRPLNQITNNQWNLLNLFKQSFLVFRHKNICWDIGIKTEFTTPTNSFVLLEEPLIQYILLLQGNSPRGKSRETDGSNWASCYLSLLGLVVLQDRIMCCLSLVNILPESFCSHQSFRGADFPSATMDVTN